MHSPSSSSSSSSTALLADVPAHDGLDLQDDGDPREALLTEWLSSCDDDWLLRDMRRECVEFLREAMLSAEGDAPVEMDMETVLALPPRDLLRAAGLTAPRLKPVLNFREWRGAHALQQSLNALAVEEMGIAKLANGQLPRDCRLDSVRALDLSMTVGDIDWAPLLESLAAWPSLEAVVLPSREHAIPCPAGWSYDDAQHCLLLDHGRAAASPRRFRNAAQAESAFQTFFQGLKALLRVSTAVAAPILQAHKLRLKEVQKSLAEHPELNAIVHKLLSQDPGGCVDAGLRRLDDIEMLLHCGQLASTADAGPMALRIALLRRADQLPAVDMRHEGENIELANALRVLIDQRLNTVLGVSLPVASAPVYVNLAGLKGWGAGEAPQGREWPKEIRQAADRVFQLEVEEDFSSLRLLLAEEEGMGTLIAEVLARDPAYQADLEELEKRYQLDYDAAQEADPDNPMAGMELNAVKEEKRAQRLFDLMAPWTDRLTAWVQAHPAEQPSLGPRASDSDTGR